VQRLALMFGGITGMLAAEQSGQRVRAKVSAKSVITQPAGSNPKI
jgi:hypothetical protein